MAKAKLGGSARRRLTRIELAGALGCSVRKVDRLIAGGLTSAGTRGQAKLYSLSSAKKVAQELAPQPTVANDVLVMDYVSQAADLTDRAHALHELWIADRDWQSSWMRCAKVIATYTATWPKRLATWAGALTPQTAPYASRAERASVAPSTPHESLLARLGLTAAEWRAEQAQVPTPILRPLLDGLVTQIAASKEFLELAKVLSAPAHPAPLPAPITADDARGLWRQARAEYRGQRVAVRRDHRRRADIAAQVPTALRAHTMAWWQTWPSAAKQTAGDSAAALVAAQHVRTEALQVLTATLGGASAPAPTLAPGAGFVAGADNPVGACART